MGTFRRLLTIFALPEAQRFDSDVMVIYVEFLLALLDLGVGFRPSQRVMIGGGPITVRPDDDGTFVSQSLSHFDS